MKIPDDPNKIVFVLPNGCEVCWYSRMQFHAFQIGHGVAINGGDFFILRTSLKDGKITVHLIDKPTGTK